MSGRGLWLLVLVFTPACGRLLFDATNAAPGGGLDGAVDRPGCVADVAIATLSTCVLFRDGHVECTGQNGRGQLGTGGGGGARSLRRTLHLDDAVRLSAGTWGYCAVRRDETVWCWGDADDGRFGSLGPGYLLEPSRIPELGGVREFEPGSTSSCVVFTDGTVACLGQNDLNQFGTGSPAASTTPVPMPLPGPATALTSGWGGHAILAADGQVFATGFAGSANFSVPTNPGVTNIVELSAHAPAYFARATDGTVWAWGRNASGELGDGTTTSRGPPVAVLGITDARSIAGGGTHACAALASGEVRCWGNNGIRLKLGVEGVTDSPNPVTVVGLPPTAEVRAGQEHSCALVADGTVWCWGHDASGQLGLGSSADGRLATQMPISCP